ncbi:MAG: hypothetical protein WC536_02310 [Patescibacteria group bacterium]
MIDWNNEASRIIDQIRGFSRRGILSGDQRREVQKLFSELVVLTGCQDMAMSYCKACMTPHLRNIIASTDAAA